MSEWIMVDEESKKPSDEAPPPTGPPKLQQLDVIVVDISRSMKARSSIDTDKTREDVSKLAFHTMVDKMICLEMDHAVGLVAFGATIRSWPLTRSYEAFHTELGRLDATQNATRLFDAVDLAATMLLEFRTAHPDELIKDCPLRIFVLTDGDDNASSVLPWQLAQRLQTSNIVLDILPMACENKKLHAVAGATGGLRLDITSVEQTISLFEREALVHVASRSTDPTTEIVKVVRSEADYDAILAIIAPPNVSPHTTTAPVRHVAEANVAAPTTQTVPPPPGAATSNGALGGVAPASLRRVMKEFVEAQSSAVGTAFIVESNPMKWKVLLHGPHATPYEGGAFVLLVEFPQTYPFKPMRMRFLTPVYHCNVNNDGAICLDVLKDKWSPALNTVTVLRSIQALLGQPNPDDPLDSMKATVMRQDRSTYDREAQQWTVRFATPLDEVMKRYGLV